MQTSNIAIFLVMAMAMVEARVYDRCDLARDLRDKYGFPHDQIATWVCIAYEESRYDTGAKSPDGLDFGIFQIDKLYWCSPPGTGCGVTCDAMVDDDIADDAKCAQTVFSVTEKERGNGFEAWTTYPRCKENVGHYTEGCF